MSWLLFFAYSYSICLTAKGAFTYQYIGCYTDKLWPNRALTVRKDTPSYGLTLEGCMTLCIGYSHFGVQYGNQCRCGNRNFAKHGGETGCSTPCSGNSGEICGGHWRNSVYAIVHKTTTKVTTAITTTPGTTTSSTTTPSTTVASTGANSTTISTTTTVAASSSGNTISIIAHSTSPFYSVEKSHAGQSTTFTSLLSTMMSNEARNRVNRSTSVRSVELYIVFGVAGALVVVVIIILVLCFLRRWKRRQRHNSPRPQSAVNPTYQFHTIQGGTTVQTQPAAENEYCEVAVKPNVSHPVPAARRSQGSKKEAEPLMGGSETDAHVYCNVSVVSGKGDKRIVMQKPADGNQVMVENDLYNT